MTHDALFIRIFGCVVGIHILLGAYLCFHMGSDNVKRPPKQAMIVQTLDLKPVRELPVAATSSPPTDQIAEAPILEKNIVPSPAPPESIAEPTKVEKETIAIERVKEDSKPKKEPKMVKKESSPPKTSEKKKPAAKPSAPKPKDTPVTPRQNESSAPVNPERAQLIAKAKQSMAQVKNGSGAKISGTQISSPKLVSLNTDAPVLQSTSGGMERNNVYEEDLMKRLKAGLLLPEYGEVRLKLTLTRYGKVEHVEIVSAESAVNKKYVQSKVPVMSFAPFGRAFNGEERYTFLIRLSNDL